MEEIALLDVEIEKRSDGNRPGRWHTWRATRSRRSRSSDRRRTSRTSSQDFRASDWTLTVLADARFLMANKLREQGNATRAAALWELGHLALEQAAASSDRSHVLWYEDIYFEAAQSLVRRGDRTGLTRQIECVAEALRNGGDNAIGALRDLAFFQFDLGEHRAGLGFLAALQRHDPSDVWAYNAIAISLGRYGLASAARLAAKRGLALIEQESDTERLRSHRGRLTTTDVVTCDIRPT